MKPPKLHHLPQFQKTLASYQASAHAKDVLKDVKLILLLAATSTGRSVVTRHLLGTGRYYYIISDTTRPPQLRDGKMEQNGVQYYFRSETDFLRDLKAGNYLEAEIIHGQQVSGISIHELERARRSHKIAFTETDIAGVLNIKEIKPDTTVIFLLPPSFTEWQIRIAGRGGLSELEIGRRLKTAESFLAEAPKHKFIKFVVAGDINETVDTIDKVIAGKRNPHQAHGRKLVVQLLCDLQKAMH